LLLVFIFAVGVAFFPGESASGQAGSETTKGAKAGDTPDALVETLRDKDPSVRLQAAQMLAQMGKGKVALPALVELLKAPQANIRLEAAQLLKQMRPIRLKAVVPSLIL